MPFVSVAKVADVPVNTKKKVEAHGTQLVLANVAGTFHALAERCPHMGGSLSDGVLTGSVIKCPRHGAEFDVGTGRNVGQAKVLFMKMKVGNAQCYAAEVRGTEVFVDVP
jgi:3-phenylpropionate/trans-cinnamate dioxygenase ferredoxin component